MKLEKVRETNSLIKGLNKIENYNDHLIIHTSIDGANKEFHFEKVFAGIIPIVWESRDSVHLSDALEIGVRYLEEHFEEQLNG